MNELLEKTRGYVEEAAFCGNCRHSNEEYSSEGDERHVTVCLLFGNENRIEMEHSKGVCPQWSAKRVAKV